MSLKAKIEAVVYASEEPVTLQQLVGLLGQEAQAELDAADALQGQLALIESEPVIVVEETEAGDPDALNAETMGTEDFAAVEPAVAEDEQERSRTGEATPESDRALAGEQPEDAPGTDARSGNDADAASEATENHAASPTGTPTEPTPAEIRARERRLREYMRSVLDGLIAEYSEGDRGLEIREVAGGFRFATKPEYHDAVRGFVRLLKPPLKLSLQALETLAVVAYKQPVTSPEVSEIRGVDSGGVLGSLMTRKLVTTAGRKQVIGRPILYKTTKEFLLRFGLRDLGELPSIEEFERLALDMNEVVQEEIPMPQDVSQDAPVPIGTRAETAPLSPGEVAREVEPSRNEHMAQADGDPNASAGSADEVSAEGLTPASDEPGEFTGNETIPPAENTVVDGRLSGLPPTYGNGNDEATGSPANDARVQAEQMGNAGEDD